MNCFITDQYVCYLTQSSCSINLLESFITQKKITYKVIDFNSPLLNSTHCGIILVSDRAGVERIITTDDPQLKQCWLLIHDENLQVEDLKQDGYLCLPITQLTDQGLENLQITGQRLHQKKLLNHSHAFNEYMFNLKLASYSTIFNNMEHILQRIAKTDATTLIYGETGTGKELVARALHQMSDRHNGPFIPVNCGAFSDELVISELFGHEKGAFTGAFERTIGLIELAENGTLFLDEIDSLSAKAQVTLLRYLQDHEIRRVGGRNTIKTNVRVIAATNANLTRKVEQGAFREDLLFRIDMMHVDLPPLRKREYDVLYLSQYFLAKLAVEKNTVNKALSSKVNDWLLNYSFPGNVRELENIVNRSFLLSSSNVIYFDDLHLPENLKLIAIKNFSSKLEGFSERRKEIINEFEKDYLHHLMLKVKGNISKAAVLAKKERRSFTRLLEKHEIQRSRYI